MKKIDVLFALIIGFEAIYYFTKQDWNWACICMMAILIVINSYRIDRLEKRK